MQKELTKRTKQTYSYNILSKRQTDVIKLRASGLMNKQIAYELGISEQTVKEHITALLRKLHVRSVEQAIVLLVKQQIIQ